MKVCLVNSVDSISGAARACYRLHDALISVGAESTFLVRQKLSADPNVEVLPSPGGKYVEKLYSYYVKYKKRNYQVKNDVSFSLSIHPDKLVEKVKAMTPNVVHFHWFNKGFVNLETFASLKTPMVWTLHDMWAFTGGCHYDQGCGKYLQQCGACPVLNSRKDNDLSRQIFNRKSKIYQNTKNLTIVTPSRWLGDLAAGSPLLSNFSVRVIPNGIDTEKFKVIAKEKARAKYNLTSDRKIILFGALKPTGDPRKGFKELNQALQSLGNQDQFELLVFGGAEDESLKQYGFKVTFVGRITNDEDLMTLYNAADVMVVPSLQENLSNTIMESLSCGVPVVAFAIGGNGDMIGHQHNGYLAKAEDHIDLARGISWVLEDDQRMAELAANAREKVLTHFAKNIIAQKHLELYQEIQN